MNAKSMLMAGLLALVVCPPSVAATANKAKDAVNVEDGVVIRGATELPKLLYIVPWKKSGAGNVNIQPGTSIFGNELAPVDREVFQRQVHFHELMQTRDMARQR